MEHGTITTDNHAALWHGRFLEGPDAAAVSFETSIKDDLRMAMVDIEGSINHAKMLCKQNLISKEEECKIIEGLESIKQDLLNGKTSDGKEFKIDLSAEDIHSFIEATLTDRVGEPGKKVHTGRSRNDQIALDEKLYLRHQVSVLKKELNNAVSVLIEIAKNQKNTLIPGFTHMQHAQPVTLAHHLCAWAWMFYRDYKRICDSESRIDFSPIGACALAGSGLPLDREYEAEINGFSNVTLNSLDTVSDRDYYLEVISDLSIIQMHLSRMCEEIVYWATTEFGFIDLSEKWSTGSSIMPQKKNPDFAELIRGKTGRVYGDMIALFTMMKGLPLSYDRDMQEDKSSFFEAYDTVVSSLRIFSEMVKTAKWNEKNMADSCEGGFLNATDVADYLVRKGMPFRTAHGVSAKLVRSAIEKNCKLEEIDFSEYKKASPLFENDIFDLITSKKCVEIRNITGGPASEQVQKQIDVLEKFVQDNIKNQTIDSDKEEWDLVFENLYK
ncbi:MAG: argininosuccinate lyase [Treponema sp.]|nr:argininosuccinate lyase [Spirochaetales bacterium]MDY6189778.1 argininosuccinate lyase [Treponema sp.]